MGAPPADGHVIVCGLTELGVRVVEGLRATATPVVVVDEHPDPHRAAAAARLGATVVAANPRAPEVLGEAGLAGARALVSVQQGDLRNLETTLAARRLRPDARIVAQIANPGVGAAVDELLAAGGALDVAALAAPTLVQICLGRDQVELPLGGVAFAVAEVPAGHQGTLRDRFGDLVPIGVVDHTGHATLCPGRDHRVAADDRVTLFATPAELVAAGVRPHAQAAADPGRARRLAVTARSVATTAGRRVGAALVAIALLVMASTVVLRLGYRPSGGGRLSVLDAVYFTVETISTVGFGDFDFAGQAPWLRVYAVALIVAGGVAIASLFALLTDLLLSRRVADALGERRVTRLAGHVVVVGLGTVGIRVVTDLRRLGRQVVVIERDEQNRNLRVARDLGAEVVAGDATAATTLRAAGAATAAAVAVLTSDDLTNLETGLALRSYLAGAGAEIPVALRIFDRDLGRTIEEAFGFADVRSPSALAAVWFVGAALGLDVVSTVAVDQELLLVAHLVVTPGGGLAGLAMQDLSARLRVLAIRRAAGGPALEHPPRRATRLAAGDEAYLVGPHDELLGLLRRNAER